MQEKIRNNWRDVCEGAAVIFLITFLAVCFCMYSYMRQMSAYTQLQNNASLLISPGLFYMAACCLVFIFVSLLAGLKAQPSGRYIALTFSLLFLAISAAVFHILFFISYMAGLSGRLLGFIP